MNANESGPSFFVLFNPDIPEGAKTLPFSVYEAALEGESSTGKFVRLECGIETGEAERIAVDGVTKDGSGEADQTGGACVRGRADAQRWPALRCSATPLRCCTTARSCC